MDKQVLLFFLISGVWFLGLSLAIYRIYALFNRLTKGVDAGDLRRVLQNVLTEEEKHGAEIKALYKKAESLEEDGRFHVQKVGITRFNPFKEVGGDHSFSLAILDGQDSGVILTSLHTRDRTRVYMKDIRKGKSRFELSEDERKALSEAQKK